MKTKKEIGLLLNQELETLIKIKEICKVEVQKHLNIGNQDKDYSNEQKRYLELIERAFNTEIYYLTENPLDYYQIYLDDEML